MTEEKLIDEIALANAKEKRIEALFIAWRGWRRADRNEYNLEQVNKIRDEIFFELRGYNRSELNDIPRDILQVKEFRKLFNFPCGYRKPEIELKEMSDENKKLHYDLVIEEVNELLKALFENDITEVLDAIEDIKYVLNGLIIHLNLQDKISKGFDIVHHSNMSKSCETEAEAILSVDNYDILGVKTYYKYHNGKYLIYRSEDNKALKSINFHKPDFSKLL